MSALKILRPGITCTGVWTGPTGGWSGMEVGEYVAFPYGVKEGAPTEVKNLSDLYQNY